MRHTLRVSAFLLIALAVTGTAFGQLRVGTFDSRLVALAYYNSDGYRQQMRDLKLDEHTGPALQNLMHYQVFSTASIPNVLEQLKGELPAIAREAGVSMIVSRWEIAYQSDGIEYVDVTPQLIARFKPNPKVQKWIDDGAKKEPLPLVKVVMMPAD